VRDSRADKAGGDSVSLGRWPEPVVGLSISADGWRLAFRTVLTQDSVYEGDLEESGESLLRVRRLTTDAQRPGVRTLCMPVGPRTDVCFAIGLPGVLKAPRRATGAV
jgi:hypothetical protein